MSHAVWLLCLSTAANATFAVIWHKNYALLCVNCMATGYGLSQLVSLATIGAY